MAVRASELIVITKAKDLCAYVLESTEKSPKRFRFTLSGRMQNLALELIEQTYRANEVFVQGEERAAAQVKRLDLQHGALTSVKLLAYMALLARGQGCLLPKQYEHIAQLASDCQNLLGAWIISDRKRNGA
ncbi:MAG: four helix bundle protein [Candidatus Accumulibacter sp.]|jgi:sulfite reductase beta subunit-like hemoprotein|nr:four helix bundle protein [Accumulibacter sp.]